MRWEFRGLVGAMIWSVAACSHPKPPEQVFAQCKITMAEVTHTTNLDDLDWSGLQTCMESKGYKLDLSLSNCATRNGPPALARCYRPNSN